MGQYLFLLLLVVLLVPMFLGVRRQKREAEKVSTMQKGLKVGDRVTTTSGLYGTVIEADDDTVDLEIAEDVVTTWLRAAVRDVRPAETVEPAAVEPATEASTETNVSADAPEHPADAAPEPASNDSTPSNGATSVEESAEETARRLTKE